jgi:hypothetical protein
MVAAKAAIRFEKLTAVDANRTIDCAGEADDRTTDNT